MLDSSVIKQLRKRDRLLKIAKRSKTPADWESYKGARNKEVFLVRRAKSEFFKTTFEIIRITPRECGRPSNRSSVSNKQQLINHLRIKEEDLRNNEEMTEAINVHLSTIADKLRKLLPDVPFETSK